MNTTCADVGSFIESNTSVVQASNVGFTSEVPDYFVVHTGPASSILRAAPLKTDAADQTSDLVGSKFY